MELMSFYDSSIFEYVIVPLLIFLARVTDVSIGTMRVIFISRGYKMLAALSGFVEVLIWIVAITQIMNNMTNVFYYIAYAAGFATGNFVGMLIEEKIALGNVLVRVVTPNELIELTKYLKSRKYGLTLHDAEGSHGTVKILFTIIPRSELVHVVDFIKRVNPQAFYTIEDIRFVNEKNLMYKNTHLRNRKPLFFRRRIRKGK
ncbi:MAG: DUF2179 domain-containing protein [Candidatus Latescibacteria bacterium]|jgi:uncharacterized protein YebE (UPF0316 family)|nr:DUF2179 domain-containing protein [Candidatus Latescibacterota bacterium]